MIKWIIENIGTIIIATVLLGVVAAVIIRMIKRKKVGKCAGCDYCSSNCSSRKRTN